MLGLINNCYGFDDVASKKDLQFFRWSHALINTYTV